MARKFYIKVGLIPLLTLLSSLAVKAESVVYVTREITPASLVRIYEALGREAKGNVCVKISTGESSQTGYLRPEFIKDLVQKVHGTIVECNTAYGGARMSSQDHWKAIRERGFMDIAPVDIMDEEDTMHIAMHDTTWLKYDVVGSHLSRYDFMINLAHFKGHQMGGLGGVLKNASIGIAATAGKAYIHSHGVTEDPGECWKHTQPQDAFVESMAAAAQAVHNYFGNGERILYISVMNKMSIDCDCNAHPQPPLIADYGIIASLDPVACDQAAYDIVTQIHNDAHNNTRPLLERIEKLHGTHIMEWGEKIGMGSRTYRIVNIDEQAMQQAVAKQLQRCPKSTLQDIYKNFFQDAFGPGHLLGENAYSKEGMQQMRTAIEEECRLAKKDRNVLPAYELTGWHGRFYRVNLSVINEGKVSLDVFLQAFLASAQNYTIPSIEAWTSEWQQVEQQVAVYRNQIKDYDTDVAAMAAMLKGGQYAVHHSKAYNKAYHPHYRLIEKGIFEQQLLPLLER